jgi:HK97 gp10 family phage protein
VNHLMGDWTVEVKGMPEVAEKLRKFKGNLAQQVPLRLAPVASEMVNMARQLVPVRTGYLRSTIYAELNVMGFEFGAKADYASFVEFGTRMMRARPFLRPAMDAHITQIYNALLTAAVEAATEAGRGQQQQQEAQPPAEPAPSGAPGEAPAPAPAPVAP